ncbi:hypothetical protein B296_00040902 [Ensete ventricosum]|uniref:Uncharacterized protein n=1 Tax=Ensete ventricosum TaxID=4639 RepID=A0A426Y7J7_ENSVE|nr:hypothetical protein B296_00040902 [Ensete ventricosum]
MERHYLTFASTRVHVFGLCLRKALCLRSMFHILCPPMLLRSSICMELLVALMPTIPRALLSLISTSTLSVPWYDVFRNCSLDLSMHLLMHYLIPDHAMTPCRSLGPLSFVEILS